MLYVGDIMHMDISTSRQKQVKKAVMFKTWLTGLLI